MMLMLLKNRRNRIVAAAVILLVCVTLGCLTAWAYQTPEKKRLRIARKYGSPTGWFMVCDTKKHELTIFKQDPHAEEGEWKPVEYNTFPCSTGALTIIDGKEQTLTPKGLTYISWKQRSHLFRDSRSWYNCWLKGGVFAVHSTLYNRDDDSPIRELDGRMGIDASTGCIRVKLKVAKWIYKTLPEETPIYVY